MGKVHNALHPPSSDVLWEPPRRSDGPSWSRDACTRCGDLQRSCFPHRRSGRRSRFVSQIWATELPLSFAQHISASRLELASSPRTPAIFFHCSPSHPAAENVGTTGDSSGAHERGPRRRSFGRGRPCPQELLDHRNELRGTQSV